MQSALILTPMPPAPLPQRGEGRGDLNLYPSPLWGRGWTATGAVISRGGTGEGIKTQVSQK